MSNSNYINGYCHIKSGKIILNKEVIFSDLEDAKPVDFFKSAYKNFQLSYPKFYKMDSLCKLAFLASELLIKSNPVTQKYAGEDIALVIANSSASLEIDTDHQHSISEKENYFPSPAVFVYTLPNILIGEIAIRNQLKGENTFFIFATFDATFMTDYINSGLNSGRAQCGIGGWVDFYEDSYEALLYIVEKNADENNLKHNIENTTLLFK